MRLTVLSLSMILAVGGARASAQSGEPPGASQTPVSPPPSELEPGVNTSDAASSPSQPAAAPPPATPGARSTSQTGRKATSSSQGNADATSRAVKQGTASQDDRQEVQTPETHLREASPGAAPAADDGQANAGGPKQAKHEGNARAGKAQDRIDLDTTSITGNRELPKVLYIVPWKRSDLGDLVGKPMNSLMDEVLTPVDRDVFNRQNRYYDALKPDGAQGAGSGGAPASPGAASSPEGSGGDAPAGPRAGH